jgi:hypothetical protein
MNSVSVTPECRLYGLRELARRAGVTAEFYCSWRIECSYQEIIVYLDPNSRARVLFPNPLAECTPELLRRRVARAPWMATPRTATYEQVPDFVVPYASRDEPETKPLFAVEDNTASCSLDLLASVALTLARAEELISPDRDIHGRFPSSASQAYQSAFLDRPIVDEYGFAFEQVISALLPGWRTESRMLRVLVSHDVDHVGLPFSIRKTAGHIFRRWNVVAAVRDLLSITLPVAPAYLALVTWMVEMESARELDCEVYWKSSGAGEFDSGYDISSPLIYRVVQSLRHGGIRQGIHPSYDTFRDADLIRSEAERLSNILGETIIDSRQHYLRWDHETWDHYETAGLGCDSTIGYADQVGFRAGTCLPYQPWMFSLNRASKVIEIPLVVMDQVLLNMSADDALQTVSDLISRCRNVGGVFTLLWHNSNVVATRHRRLYTTVLDLLAAEKPGRLPPSSMLHSHFADLQPYKSEMANELPIHSLSQV